MCKWGGNASPISDRLQTLHTIVEWWGGYDMGRMFRTSPNPAPKWVEAAGAGHLQHFKPQYTVL
uniref:Uncharacterized protein n=1 Tax=Anopheles quadriannulatus TaxID=34691 RepID=A0A182XTK3_ANOQN